jgi:hypothetical protein
MVRFLLFLKGQVSLQRQKEGVFHFERAYKWPKTAFFWRMSPNLCVQVTVLTVS